MWGDIHCIFDLYLFPWWLVMLNIFFMYLLAISMSPWKNIYFEPLSIFKLDCLLLLSCKCSLYILYINPYQIIWFANISSISADCLFIFFLLLWFCKFSLATVPLVKFYLCCFCFYCYSQKVIAKTNIKKHLPYAFFSRSFMVSDLLFKSLIYFRFQSISKSIIFVTDLR